MPTMPLLLRNNLHKANISTAYNKVQTPAISLILRESVGAEVDIVQQIKLSD